MKHARSFLTIFTLITVGLSLVQIVVSNAFSTDGIVLGNMQKQLAQLESENMQLREQVFSLSSYTHIASSAGTMGFVGGNNQLVLTGARPLAIRQ